MKRYTFGAFLVDESNQQAYDLCQKIAQLDDAAPRLVVLVGEEGCGKTHLLYSIVNQVRASSVRTGLACVTAHNLPEQVRALIEDPSPLDRIKHAVLLVDQLELVDKLDDSENAPSNPDYLVEELQAVIRIFVDKGHYVVLASNIYPTSLRNLPGGVKQLLGEGTIVPIAPLRPEHRVDLLKQQIRRENEDIILQQQQEITELRALAERSANGPAGGVDASALNAERAARDETERKLAVAKAYSDTLQQELDDARRQIQVLHEVVDANTNTPAHQELNHLRADLDLAHAQAASAGQEVERLLGELRRLEAEKAEMAGRDTQLREAQARLGSVEAEKQTLSTALDVARQDSQHAREEANNLLARAQGLLDQIEANRTRFAQTEAEHLRQIQQLETALANSAATTAVREELDNARKEAIAQQERASSLETAFAVERADFTREKAEFEQLLKAGADQLRIERDVARSERDELRQQRDDIVLEQQQLLTVLEHAKQDKEALVEQIDGMRASHDVMQARIEELETSLANTKRELDALRIDAAEEVARAHAQAGELENRLVRTLTDLRDTRAQGSAAAQQASGLAARLAEIATGIEQVGNGLAVAMMSSEPDEPPISAFVADEKSEEGTPAEPTAENAFDQAAFDDAFANAADYVIGTELEEGDVAVEDDDSEMNDSPVTGWTEDDSEPEEDTPPHSPEL